MKNVLLTVFLIIISSYAATGKYIALTDGVRLRSAPEFNSENIIGSVNTSEEFEVLAEKKVNGVSWMNIETATEQRGWVVSNYISARGEEKILTFCETVISRIKHEKQIDLDREGINRIIKMPGTSREFIRLSKEKNIPLDFMGYLLLSNRDKRGVGLLVESLKRPVQKKRKIFFALQSIAKDTFLQNNYEEFRKWFLLNKKNIKIDDFALVRIFYSLR